MIDVEESKSKLPPEVLAELKKHGSRGSPRREQVLDIVKDCGGKATLDQIIVGMWVMFETKMKRENASSVVHKMQSFGVLDSAGPGICKLPEVEEQGQPEKIETEQNLDPRDVTDAGAPNSLAVKGRTQTITCANCSREKDYPVDTTPINHEGNEFCRRECRDDFIRDSKGAVAASNAEESAYGKAVKCGNCDGTIPTVDVGVVKLDDIDVCSHLCKRELKNAINDE